MLRRTVARVMERERGSKEGLHLAYHNVELWRCLGSAEHDRTEGSTVAAVLRVAGLSLGVGVATQRGARRVRVSRGDQEDGLVWVL